ncbi:hypothetical protein [Ignicoccus hospitalis]|uniref:CobQ/CobB/MinD/ParA nucleotide binding domain-containing protein n=1 Tax=Ignicoccus hospitalis (strain KIN4/I / DSM 18386 / JCM 14125) TaxID=453591 RepID=A8ACA8_IGNH4|nr:hypothetical protein [Ignicoccus hospitalis]ABU82560.1 hypothetical protein Igni_1384 [Ignicoccus hospitalis KIN4/I]HIH90725.1 hypothetical protein [Desulfurococcaceae archaeon]
MLVLVTPTCRGSGSKVLALELAIHLNIETKRPVILIDLSTDFTSFDMETNCLTAYFNNIIHTAQATRRFEKAPDVLITKIITEECMKIIDERKFIKNIFGGGLSAQLAEFVNYLLHKDFGVIVYVPPDMIGEYLLERAFVDTGLVNRAKIVITSNEKKSCIDRPRMISSNDLLSRRVASIIINKIPMGVLDGVREDVKVRLLKKTAPKGSPLLIGLIPLTMQLYYRDLNSYLPLLMKAEYNEHAKSISKLLTMVVRNILGVEKESKILTVVRGMISEQRLGSLVH